MKSTFSQRFLTIYMKCARFFTVSAFTLFSSSASVLADDLEPVESDVDIVQYQLRVDDLTPQQFDALANLAASSSTGNITNDVAAILDVLNSVLQGSAIKTVPMTGGSSGHTLAYEVGRGLFNGYNPGTVPTAANSYVYQIQRALYGQNGVPSSSTAAVVPTLARIEQLIQTQSSGSGGGSVDMTVVSNIYTLASNWDYLLQHWDSAIQSGIPDILDSLYYQPTGGSGVGLTVSEMMYPAYYVDSDFLDSWNREGITDTPGKALELLLASPYLIPNGPGDWVAMMQRMWMLEQNFTLGSSQGGLLDSQNHSVRTTIADADPGFYNPFGSIIYDYGATPVVNALATLVDEWWQNGQVDVLTSNTADVVTYLGDILGDTTLVNANMEINASLASNQLEYLEDIYRALGYTGSGMDTLHSDFRTSFQTALRQELLLQDTYAALSNVLAGLSAQSYTQLAAEVDATDAPTYDNPTNVPLPDYELPDDTLSVADSALTSGQSTVNAVVQQLSARPNTGGSSEIVLIPEFTIGGIHVSEQRASLDSSIVPVCRSVCSFLYAVGLFCGVFCLAKSEYAFWVSWGRWWGRS